MASAPRHKNADKQGICKKLVSLLKKHYKGAGGGGERPVLDSMIYAVCLENASVEDAAAAIERLLASFHDLNEIRVSSVTELTSVFEGMEQPDWRAVQVRGVLQAVFEKEFSFDFESLRKKTLELATKSLTKIRDLSPFARAYTLQEALGSHLVPLDAAQSRAVIWLGLADVGSNEEAASAALRPVLRKSETAQFCDLLRAFAVDPPVRVLIEEALASPPADGFDCDTAPARVTDLLVLAEKRRREMKHAAKAAAKAPAKTDRGKTKPSSSKPHHEDGEPRARDRAAGKESGGKASGGKGSARDSRSRSSRPQPRSNPRSS